MPRGKRNADQPVLPAEEFRPPACWPQIEAASRTYAQFRDQRIAVGQEEKKAKDALKSLLNFHGIKFTEGVDAIEYDGVRIEKVETTDIRVRITTELSNGDGSDSNEPTIDGTDHEEDDAA